MTTKSIVAAQAAAAASCGYHSSALFASVPQLHPHSLSLLPSAATVAAAAAVVAVAAAAAAAVAAPLPAASAAALLV